MQCHKCEKELASIRNECQPVCMETILIVEDEIDLAEVASFHLENAGFTTLRAGNAQEAIDVILGEDEIDLVFSDIVLPGGIGGFRLVQHIHGLNPNLKLLLTSAYFERPLDVPGNELITNLTRSLLKKPYSKSELIGAVHKALKTTPESVSLE